MIACFDFEKKRITRLALKPVRRRGGKQTIFRTTKQEKKEIERPKRLCELSRCAEASARRVGTTFKVKGDALLFDLQELSRPPA